MGVTGVWKPSKTALGAHFVHKYSRHLYNELEWSTVPYTKNGLHNTTCQQLQTVQFLYYLNGVLFPIPRMGFTTQLVNSCRLFSSCASWDLFFVVVFSAVWSYSPQRLSLPPCLPCLDLHPVWFQPWPTAEGEQ